MVSGLHLMEESEGELYDSFTLNTHRPDRVHECLKIQLVHESLSTGDIELVLYGGRNHEEL